MDTVSYLNVGGSDFELVDLQARRDIKNKADKTALDGVASGSPAGTFSNLNTLQSSLEADKTKIYLTLDDGKWNYWNGSAWVAGGVYLNSANKYKEFIFKETDFTKDNGFILNCFLVNIDDDNTNMICVDDNWAITPFIKIDAGTSINYTNCIVTSIHKSIALYDENAKLIETKKKTDEEEAGITDFSFVNEKARYVRFTVSLKRKVNQQIKIGMYGTANLEFYTEQEIKSKNTAKTDVTQSYMLNDVDDNFYVGYIKFDTENIITDNNWRTSWYIPLKNVEEIEYTLPYHNNCYSAAFYDENKSFIKGLYREDNFPYGEIYSHGYFDKEYLKDIAYVRFTFNVSDDKKLDSQYIRFKRKNNILSLANTTIFLAGDSRSSTDYDFYKDTLKNKTNAKIIVGGASGWTTAQIASNSYFSRLTENKHDFSIWLVGGNDIGGAGTVGTFSEGSQNFKNGEEIVQETDITQNYNGTKFIQAVDHIMRKYKGLFYDWRLAYRGQKPKMIFCTDLPQKREGGESTWSLKDNWERKRNAIIECCEKNNIACLDLYKLCNFDMEYEIEWTSPTDKVHNKGLYFMDGLHPNEYGIDVITSLEVDFLNKYMKINI